MTSPNGLGIIYVDEFSPHLGDLVYALGNSSAMADISKEQTSVNLNRSVPIKWLTTIYLSEVSFLLHLPLFIQITTDMDIYTESSDNAPSIAKNANAQTIFTFYAQKFLSKFWNIVKRIRAYKKEMVKIWKEKHPKPKPYFQLTIFVLRCTLNFAALVIIFFDLRKTAKGDARSAADMADIILNGSTAKNGWWLIFVSFLLYMVSYIHQRYHLTHVVNKAVENHDALAIPTRLYWTAHISVINFSLDLPGM